MMPWTTIRARVGAAGTLLALIIAVAPAAEAQDAETSDAGTIRELLAAGRYEAAIARARAVLPGAEEPARVSLALGEALFAVGEIEAARETFENVARSGGAGALEATLQAGLIARYRGERGAAQARFERLLDAYNARADLDSRELAAVARAASELGVAEPGLYRDAVRVYGEALQKDPGNISARVALGDLLLAKYNNTEALEVFREALAEDETYPPALLGLARSRHFDHDAEALDIVRACLDVNPHFVPARAFLARLYIESEDYAQARREAMRALEVNPRSLEALAVLAAVRFLTHDEAGFEEALERALAVNPRSADVYNTLAELAVRNRLYREAVDFARRAVEADSRSWKGYGLLGLNQLRIGEMEAGRENLERAFEGDPFNVWIKNTLDLTDTFGDYEVIRREDMVVVLHREEAALLAPYVIDVAERAYATFVRRYGYTPPQPVRIELYPSHADFSVRSVGLAGIGILGVSFGPVVALDSPSARSVGSFHWASALWHELAHTFHLGLTRHRVPRWFSEGLAVHEEHRAGEGWGGDVSPAFLEAYRDGELLPVSELNDGFVRPRYPEQVMHSYYQASLVFALIEERWGFDAVRAMLQGYRGGMSTPEVVSVALGLDMATLDREFEGYLRERFRSALAALGEGGEDAEPGPFMSEMRAGVAALEAEALDRAEAHLRRAQALFPEYAGDDSAYVLLAEIHARRGETEKAARQLERMVAINAEHVEAHAKLSRLREELGDLPGAAEALAGAVLVHPYDPEMHARLASLYERTERWARAARERAAVVALGPVDMAEARYLLARAHARAGRARAARREVLRALEIAPSYGAALELLLELRGMPSSDTGGATDELSRRGDDGGLPGATPSGGAPTAASSPFNQSASGVFT